MSEARLNRQPGTFRPDMGQLIRAHQPEASRSFPKMPLVAESPVRREVSPVTQPVKQQPVASEERNIRSELSEMAGRDAADKGIRDIQGGVYQQVNRAKENSPKLLRWYTPVVTQIYSVDNPDGTQTVYSESIREGGVYEEQYSQKSRFGKRKLISRTLVGETMDFEPERKPDGSMEVSETYKGEIRIYSKERVEQERKVDRVIDDEPIEETIKRLNARITPFPKSQAEVMQTIQQLAVIQGSMAMVKDSVRDQVVLGAATTLITGASSAFLFGVPASVFGGFAPAKTLLDIAVVTEAYKLLRTPTTEEVKEKLKPRKLIFSLLKNVPMLVVGIIQQVENGVNTFVEQRSIMNDFKKENPHIRDKRMLTDMLNDEEFEETHAQWLKQLKRLNPHLSDDAVEHVAKKVIAHQAKNLKQIEDDFNKVQRVMTIPMGIYAGVLALGFGLSPFTGGASVLAANIAAPLISGIARPVINYRMLKDLKEEIKRDRPNELIPIQQQMQQAAAAQNAQV